MNESALTDNGSERVTQRRKPLGYLYDLFCIIFPERCPYCQKIIKSAKIACDDCTDKLDTLQKPIIRGTYGYRCISSFVYGGFIRRMILRIKYHDRIQSIPQCAVIMERDIRRLYNGYRFDVITSVPMHKKDLKKRGYNQSELLAKELSKRLDIPYADLLVKVKRTKKQQSCSYKERKTNVRGAFQVIDKTLIEGKNILIIDDIITSGETLGNCCKTLNRSKPGVICCATIANASHRAAENNII